MKKFLYIFIFFFSYSALAFKIGVLVVATGKYIEFVPNLVSQGKQYFLPNHEVTYFIFTDMLIKPEPSMIICHQEQLTWPYSTMLRYETYLRYKHLYKEYDYLFILDADMQICEVIDETLLSKLTGVLHPGFASPKIFLLNKDNASPLIYEEKYWKLLSQNYTHETRRESTAFLPNGKFYFCGGVFGGEKNTILNLLETLSTNIRIDMANGIIALWHDESHLNWYFNTQYVPEKILTPLYCYPDVYYKGISDLPNPKIIAITKNHALYQTN